MPIWFTATWITLVVAGILFFLIRSVVAGLGYQGAKLHTKCPFCSQRVAYFKRQVGHSAGCPNCRRRFSFPGPGGVAQKPD
jgi:hypothetical protein